MKSTGKSLTDRLIQKYELEKKAPSGWRIFACKRLAGPTLVPRVNLGMEWGEGTFQPGSHHARRALEGTLGCSGFPWVLSHCLVCAVMVWGWVGS